MSENVDKLHHVDTMVSDMERSKAFYSTLMDITAKCDKTISGPALRNYHRLMEQLCGLYS